MRSSGKKQGAGIKETPAARSRERSRSRASAIKRSAAGTETSKPKVKRTRSKAKQIAPDSLSAAHLGLQETAPPESELQSQGETPNTDATDSVTHVPQIYPDVFDEEAKAIEDVWPAAISSDPISNPDAHAVSWETGQQEPAQVEQTLIVDEIPSSDLIVKELLIRSPWRRFTDFVASKAGWFISQIKTQRAKKRLRVCESVSLGEKCFLAVIQVDGEEFLVGGASHSISTLARLERSPEFSEVLKQQWTEDPARA